MVLRKAPPLPFLDASVHGQEVPIPALCHAKDGEAAARPFREIGTPHADAVGPCPFTAFQQAFDPLLTPGARNYWKSHNFGELSDGVIDTLIHYAGRLPSDETEIFLGQLGGPANRVKPEATAYPHRDANFVVNLHTRWRDPAEDQRCIEWTRALFADLAPWATGGVYVNIMPDDETGQDRLRAAYGPHCRPAWPAVRPGRTEFESLAPRFDNLREPAPGAGHGGFPLHSMQVWRGPRLRGHPE